MRRKHGYCGRSYIYLYVHVYEHATAGVCGGELPGEELLSFHHVVLVNDSTRLPSPTVLAHWPLYNVLLLLLFLRQVCSTDCPGTC